MVTASLDELRKLREEAVRLRPELALRSTNKFKVSLQTRNRRAAPREEQRRPRRAKGTRSPSGQSNAETS
jgi:hypothetical protein